MPLRLIVKKNFVKVLMENLLNKSGNLMQTDSKVDGKIIYAEMHLFLGESKCLSVYLQNTKEDFLKELMEKILKKWK